MAKYGKPLSLDDKIKVDLIVVGSSAVDLNGARLGKGEVSALALLLFGKVALPAVFRESCSACC